ncbi:hypothetical protein BGW80DRAFT_1506899 [Lactifluus volemus]|nr:hypothetical protein BGW80DRAFT_1506899 [Lactifluus volemus]
MPSDSVRPKSLPWPSLFQDPGCSSSYRHLVQLLAMHEPSDMANRSPLLDFVVVAAVVATQEVVPALMGDVVADREDVGLMKGVGVYPTVVAGGELGGTCGDEGENRVLKVPKIWGCDDCPGVSGARELEGVPDVRRPAVIFDLAGAIAGEGAVAVVVAGGEGGAASSSVGILL